MGEKMKRIAIYPQKFNKLLGVNLPLTDIYKSSGLDKHILKRHPNCAPYMFKIHEIIRKPDYLGANPKEKDSIELVKRYADNVLLALKLDKKKNYIYIASLYDISDAKLKQRIKSGRLKKY